MVAKFKNIISDFGHLFFPHNCLACGIDVLNANDLICLKCIHHLPETFFASIPNNPIEKNFYGRIKIEKATASFYYTKDSMIQTLIKELKYNSNKEVGLYFGKLLGKHLLQSKRFDDIDCLIPLPLNKKKQFKRGYNQAEIICKGIVSEFEKPIITNVSVRTVYTESQTTMGRINRWQNMENVFEIANPKTIEGKHILLVDDVVTTGATLESCGTQILKIPNTKLSIATIGFTV